MDQKKPNDEMSRFRAKIVKGKARYVLNIPAFLIKNKIIDPEKEYIFYFEEVKE